MCHITCPWTGLPTACLKGGAQPGTTCNSSRSRHRTWSNWEPDRSPIVCWSCVHWAFFQDWALGMQMLSSHHLLRYPLVVLSATDRVGSHRFFRCFKIRRVWATKWLSAPGKALGLSRPRFTVFHSQDFGLKQNSNRNLQDRNHLTS